MTVRTYRPKTDQQKQSIYLSRDMLEQLAAESERLDRSKSWLIQHAWAFAREHIKRMPAQ